MKTTNINIDEIKRYSTVTNPIKADDLNTPQAYAYTLRRAIVTDCTPEQRAELVVLLNGKDTAEGVTFNNTKANRYRLHRWQNEQSRKERAAMLGEGWQYVDGLNHGTQPGDLVTCVDGTRGRVTKSNPESCVIEFETENGQRLTVAGYFRYTPSEKSEEITEAEERARLLVVFNDERQYRRARDFYCLKASEAPTAYYAEEYSDEIRALYFTESPDALDALERELTEDLEHYGFTGYHFEED